MEFDQDNIYELYLQNFHIESVHPPNISIEDEVVHILPVLAMLLDWFRHDDPVQYAVHIGIIGIWLNQKWCPVKLHSGIVILQLMKIHYTPPLFIISKTNKK